VEGANQLAELLQNFDLSVVRVARISKRIDEPPCAFLGIAVFLFNLGIPLFQRKERLRRHVSSSKENRGMTIWPKEPSSWASQTSRPGWMLQYEAYSHT